VFLSTKGSKSYLEGLFSRKFVSPVAKMSTSEELIQSFLATLELNEERFLPLLTKLIGEGAVLQNNPSQGFIPREDAASDHLLQLLQPYLKENGGLLEVQRVSFVEGRGNIILTYPGTSTNSGDSGHIVSFVGSHLDVVPADISLWDKDPFKLVLDEHWDGETLYGRGTTDCLGHVALITDFMISLAEARIPLKTTVVAVFIVNEENGSFKGIGVDQLVKEGYLSHLKAGPVYWIDTADSQPCQGTAGNIPWKLDILGKLFHSGMPHLAINPIEMGHDVMSYLQKRFYARFPRHDKEILYNFIISSTMKPTQISCTTSSLNQIPPQCTIMGDIRLTPFYDVSEVVSELHEWVKEINLNPQETLGHLSDKGPYSKYQLSAEEQGSVQLTIIGAENGIAVDMNSPGYHALLSATTKVLGEVKPYSINGSLPLVRDMQTDGFDIQMAGLSTRPPPAFPFLLRVTCPPVGYGLSSKYHANNESANLSDLKKATKIFANVTSPPSFPLLPFPHSSFRLWPSWKPRRSRKETGRERLHNKHDVSVSLSPRSRINRVLLLRACGRRVVLEEGASGGGGCR
jgi:acetylornithine deacetylase